MDGVINQTNDKLRRWAPGWAQNVSGIGNDTNNTFENKFEKGYWMEFANLVLGIGLKLQFGKLERCMMGASWGKRFLEFGMVPTILLNI